MPRIKSLLNGEVSNVRADIAREMIKLGVATALDSLEDIAAQRKGYVVVSPDGTVMPDHEPAYRLPKPGNIQPAKVTWSIDYVSSGDITEKWVAIRRDTVRGNVTDHSLCLLPPDAVHDRTDHKGDKFCSVFGVPVPKHILEEYRQIWKSNRNARAGVDGHFKPHPNAQSDKASIGSTVAASTERGVIEGMLQLEKRGGPRN